MVASLSLLTRIQSPRDWFGPRPFEPFSIRVVDTGICPNICRPQITFFRKPTASDPSLLCLARCPQSDVLVTLTLAPSCACWSQTWIADWAHIARLCRIQTAWCLLCVCVCVCLVFFLASSLPTISRGHREEEVLLFRVDPRTQSTDGIATTYLWQVGHPLVISAPGVRGQRNSYLMCELAASYGGKSQRKHTNHRTDRPLDTRPQCSGVLLMHNRNIHVDSMRYLALT